MKVFGDSKADKELKDKYILLDNDFLNQIFKDEDVFREFLTRFDTASFLIDTLTKFEFLRDIHQSKQLALREQFISKPMFYPITSSNQHIFLQLQKNALLLSQIYCHQHQNNKPSFIDLMLAALTMYQSQTTMLMTGNKKDFPRCVFDTITVFNVEQDGDGAMRAYSVVAFNHKKFQSCLKALGSNIYFSEGLRTDVDDIAADETPF